jgi:probable HAF family extracellular repeat protein
MSAMRGWLVAVLVGCLSLAAWGCDGTHDPASISGVSPSTVSQGLSPSGAPLYTVTPLNSFGASSRFTAPTTGLRINQSGDVVGWTTQNGPAEPMLNTPENGVIILPTATSQPSGVARDLSDRSGGVITVVGEARLDGNGSAIHAVRWLVAVPQGTVTRVTDLGVLPGHSMSVAYAVNGAGQIAGTSDPSSFLSIRSFLYSDGRMVDLGLGGIGQSARALDLNASGLITGYLGLRAFRWSSTGRLQSLGVPSGWAYSFGNAINASGQVAGLASSASGNAAVVARYTDGAGWKVLGGMGQTNTGNGINRWGDVVGTGFPHTGGQAPFLRGVLYTDELGALVYIDDFLLVPGSWKIMAAFDINDAGQITGWGIDNRTGLRSAVVLTPSSVTSVNQPPVARFTVTCAPGQCVLDASPSTDDQGIASYQWKAAAKVRAAMTGVRITRVWIPGGVNTYQETLTVTDGAGLTHSLKQTVAIPSP